MNQKYVTSLRYSALKATTQLQYKDIYLKESAIICRIERK